MSTWRIEFAPDSVGCRVVRDGVDISSTLSGLTLDISATGYPHISLHLGGPQSGVAEGDPAVTPNPKADS